MLICRPGSHPLVYVVPPVFVLFICFSLLDSEGGIFDPILTGDKFREAERECMRRIANMCLSQGAESDPSAIIGEAARALGALPTPSPLPDLSVRSLFLNFLGQTLDFAVSPRESRHPSAVHSGIDSEARLWEWIGEQFCVEPNCSARLGTAGYPSTLAPFWPRSCLPAGMSSRTYELPHTYGSLRRTIRLRQNIS